MRITHILNPLSKEIKSVPHRIYLFVGAGSMFMASLLLHPNLNADPSQLSMINPVAMARISSEYGNKNKFHSFHNGIDLAAKSGTPIISSAAGRVIVSTDLLENRKNYGKIIVIDHGNGLKSLYSHLNNRTVEEGENVEKGQVIGKVGATGRATGPHLHFEVMLNSKKVDPRNYIQFEKRKT